MKNMVVEFHYERKSSCATTKSTLFSVSKDEWDAKEDLEVYEKCIVCTVVCHKAPLHCRAVKIKPVALRVMFV